MKLEEHGPLRIVTLSRRNLESLLHKLDWEGSERTIVNGPLVVKAEDNDEHYRDREPGPMHPTTEQAISKSDKL